LNGLRKASTEEYTRDFEVVGHVLALLVDGVRGESVFRTDEGEVRRAWLDDIKGPICNTTGPASDAGTRGGTRSWCVLRRGDVVDVGYL